MHNFEQIRFPLEGEFQYAEGKVLPAGWVGYFPEGVYYGPQIRHKGLYMLLLQYGGASGHGFFSEHQYVSGQEALRKKGTIAKGKFSFTDKDGNDVKPQLIFQPAPNCKPIDEDLTENT